MKVMVGLWALLASCCASGRSQDLSPAPGESAAGNPTAPGPPASISLERLAEQLQAMEATNKKLAEELERTKREHDRQIRQILERFGAPTGRSEARSEAEARDLGAVGTTPLPRDGTPTTVPDNPVPD